MTVWTLDQVGGYTGDLYPGPFTGWTPVQFAVGYDNDPRILWTNSGGRVSLWDIYAPGKFTYEDYGPCPGWMAAGLTAGIE